MKDKEIHKILQAILLLQEKGETLFTISKFGIEKPYLDRAIKILRILKEELSPEDNPNFLPFIKTEKIQLKGGQNDNK